MVVGDMIYNSGTVKKFVQSFYLSEQQGSFFIFNSACRYLRDAEVCDEEFEQEQVVSPAEPAEKEIPSESISAEIPQEKICEPEPIVEAASANLPKEEKSEQEIDQPKGPQSWAKLAANQRHKWGLVSQKVVPSSIPMKEEVKEKKERKETEHGEQKQRSINVAASAYVKNLPENTTFHELKQSLGKIKFVDFNANKSGAVVEFYSVEERTAAIGKEIQIRNFKVVVEERRPRPANLNKQSSSESQKKKPSNKNAKSITKQTNVSTLE